MTEIRAIQHARSTLNGGITSVRDLGGRDGITLALRDAIRSGLIPGPRIRASDSMVCMTGGTGWLSWGKEVDGPIEVIKLVRQLIKSGVDVVKFMATGGVMTPGVEPGNEQLTEDELKAGIGEAHKAGKKTAAHVEGVEGALNAIRAGSDSIEHGIALSEEAVSLMGERNIFLVPTLSALHNIEVHGTEGGIPSFAVDKCHKIIPLHTESLRMAHEAGIRVAMGTDAGTPLNAHGSNLAELKLLVDAGISPMYAIESSTRIASEVLGMEEELGTIEEGKLADLVMVEGNPLEQIDILLKPEAIRLVMQGGRIVKEVVKTQV